MDSGNSSSRDVDLVSSAEEDYDDPHHPCGSPPSSSATSRFFLGNQIPPPAPSTSSPSLFDSFSSFLEPLPGSPNLEPGWQRSVKRLASSPMAALSSSSPSPFVGATTPINSGAVQPSEAGSMYQRTAGEAVGSAPPAAKSGKKRSRASRRAPTTVLTTDTTNFRQMVQEFTGIPAPPFVSTSPFSRTAARLDLLAAAGGGPGAAPPPFLLRPFPQKPQILTMANTTINNNTGNNCNNDVSPNNPSSSAPTAASLGTESAQDFLLRRQHDAHSGPLQASNLPNTLFSLQSLMNLAPSKFQLPNFLPGKLPSAGLSPFQMPPMSTTMSVGAEMHSVGGVLDEFGGSGCHVGLSSQGNVGAPNMTNSMNMSSGDLPTVGSSRVFLGGIADGGGGGGGGSGGGGESNENQVGIRPLVAVGGGDLCNPQRGGGSSCKLNYNASSSDFHVEKGSEGMSRGEGMVDSWICSSD
ncbi:uncharacterized protein LOC116259312 [Nymphaea colorata]|nr:uncharacterized protein LOC116259312 [Nymphaea colorata]